MEATRDPSNYREITIYTDKTIVDASIPRAVGVTAQIKTIKRAVDILWSDEYEGKAKISLPN